MIKKYQETVITTDVKTTRMLQILAESNVPLTSREIEKELAGETKRDRQVYRILENELCVKKFDHSFPLFIWEDLLASIDAKESLYKDTNLKLVIEKIKGIDWPYDWATPEFKKDDDANTILITNGQNNPRKIRIERDPKSKNRCTLTIFKDGVERRTIMPVPLTIEQFAGKSHVSYRGVVGNPIEIGRSYLKVSLNERTRKEVERIKSRNPDLFNCTDEVKKIPSKCLLLPSEINDEALHSQVSQLESDRRNWKYSLNTRGLVLYLLAIINEENRDARKRKRNVKISHVLENLSENYNVEFRFLEYYKEIKELYYTIAKDEHKSEYKYFQVGCLKRIALELQNVIDTIDKAELDYYITKRYEEDSTWYFITGWLPTIPGSVPSIIIEYYRRMHIIMRGYLGHQLEECEFEANRFPVPLDIQEAKPQQALSVEG
jgi:hypothetical protein